MDAKEEKQEKEDYSTKENRTTIQKTDVISNKRSKVTGENQEARGHKVARK